MKFETKKILGLRVKRLDPRLVIHHDDRGGETMTEHCGEIWAIPGFVANIRQAVPRHGGVHSGLALDPMRKCSARQCAVLTDRRAGSILVQPLFPRICLSGRSICLPKYGRILDFGCGSTIKKLTGRIQFQKAGAQGVKKERPAPDLKLQK